MEMSTLDKNLPRYYKGYDVDVLLRKMDQNILTEKEDAVLDEVHNTCYDALREQRIKELKAKGIHSRAIEICGPFVNLNEQSERTDK